jgi:hypothetical protein
VNKRVVEVPDRVDEVIFEYGSADWRKELVEAIERSLGGREPIIIVGVFETGPKPMIGGATWIKPGHESFTIMRHVVEMLDCAAQRLADHETLLGAPTGKPQ